jgi:hypothetical protein
MKVEGTILASSPRAGDFLRVYESRTIPLKSPLPTRGRKPDGTEALFYKVDLAALRPDQLERVVSFAMERFGLSEAEVRQTFDDPDHGLPILADDVTVSTDTPWFL